MTPLEKLRALAAAKKSAQFQEEVTPDAEVSKDTPSNISGAANSSAGNDHNVNGVTKDEHAPSASNQNTEVNQELLEGETQQGLEVSTTEVELLEKGDKEDREGSLDVGAAPDPGSISRLEADHPLKMQLAELEQALTEKLPEFRTILRDIHAKLRQDPDCVTAMSEDEIGSIVQGLIHHANVDVIAPRAVKAAKKASKVPVSASDL